MFALEDFVENKEPFPLLRVLLQHGTGFGNLFVYCFNAPVNMADPSGHWPKEITAGIAAGTLVVAGVGMVFAASAVAVGAMATSVTFSNGANFGFGYDYFSGPIQILEW